MTAIIYGTLELGMIYAILALGLYISFRVLDMPDLTVDGSFVTGAAVSAVMCLNNYPFLGLLAAMAAGGITGIVTSLLHTRLKIQMLLSGILTMLALYSINLKIMGNRPNIALIGSTTIFTAFKDTPDESNIKMILLSAISIIVLVMLFLFLKTKLGFAVRATGNNECMASAQGINTDFTKLIGLALANALIALSGGILAQYQSFADVGMGIGMLVVGLASIMIGEVLFRLKSIFGLLLATALGSVIYRFIIMAAIRFGMPPTDLKLVSAAIVVLALSVPAVKNYLIRTRSRLAAVNMKRRKESDA
ncbi:putative ABC transport system permease protein [Ruminiclostridium sufflavum DSM 19573]|uniref:Putative ABC transport system permease protein n=1 Tax=Ruminiclostridium sufflavum DSM 19573 TaxID=1121337 RepID=A0A318XTQ1_9FIRM|nr:ABC transporter permease [Ruminiclostridium sufflavum]PYG90223.1 putative ABC transport system permease protein [Ruminiclostridium sufflavum DSM 19573]